MIEGLTNEEVDNMSEQEFLQMMKKTILDTETDLLMNTKLSDIEEWDSLSLVSFIGMSKMKYGKSLDTQEVMRAKSIADLYAFLQ